MILITDSNIIMSAIFTPDGEIAKVFNKLVKKGKAKFIAPEYMYEEVIRYLEKMAKHRKVSKVVIINEIQKILTHITFYDLNKISSKNLQKALQITKDIDQDDAIFIALHFQTKHKIWCGDSKLKKGLEAHNYNTDFIVLTSDIVKILNLH